MSIFIRKKKYRCVQVAKATTYTVNQWMNKKEQIINDLQLSSSLVIFIIFFLNYLNRSKSCGTHTHMEYFNHNDYGSDYY